MFQGSGSVFRVPYKQKPRSVIRRGFAQSLEFYQSRSSPSARTHPPAGHDGRGDHDARGGDRSTLRSSRLA